MNGWKKKSSVRKNHIQLGVMHKIKNRRLGLVDFKTEGIICNTVKSEGSSAQQTPFKI